MNDRTSNQSASNAPADRHIMRSAWVRFVVTIVLLCGIVPAALAPARAAATTATQCYTATGAAAHLLCWLDFTGYTGTGAATFSLTLPDKSILTGTVTNTGTLSQVPVVSPLYAGGPSFGASAYTGVGGKPAFPVVNDGTTKSPIVLSNLTLTDPLTHAVNTVAIAAADAEDTDGHTEIIYWQTTGANWTVLQIMPGVTTTNNVCTLSALGANVQCNAATAGPPVEAYILRSIVNTTTSGAAQTVGMSATTPAQEGLAFAIDLAQLTVAKSVGSRVATADQFTVAVSRGVNGASTPTPTGTPLATASTTGTGTTATATTPNTIPNEAYVWSESMAAGSISALSQYATTATCINAATGSSTTLPTNVAEQSLALTPNPDDQITCTFTNNGLSMTNTANAPTATDASNTAVSDFFTLKNTSAVPGTFVVQAPTITSSLGGTIAPTSYAFNNQTYTTLAALNAAIAAAGTTAANGTILIAVTYTTSADNSTSDVVKVPSVIASGTGTSAVATATETDSLTASPKLSLAKSHAGNFSAGNTGTYNLVLTNSGNAPTSGTLTIVDTVPSGLSYNASVGSNWTCTAGTGTVTCTSTTVVAAGATAQTLSLIFNVSGAGATVTNSATTSGGGAAASSTATDPTTIVDQSMTSGSNCYVATGANQHLICWLDFAGYAGIGSETFSLKMPDGSILTGTVDNTGTTEAPVSSPLEANLSGMTTAPVFGNDAYTGIQGQPIFDDAQSAPATTESPVVITNLTLTDPLGFKVTTVGMVGADAETTIQGAGQTEKEYWQTTGAGWTQLELMMNSHAPNSVCTLTALPAQNVTCTGNGLTPVNAYLLRSIVNTNTNSAGGQTFGMGALSGFTQAWSYGINLVVLSTTKNVSSRVASSDQFTVAVTRGTNGSPAPGATPLPNSVPTGPPLATASTSGTGTTATATTPNYVIPNETYIFNESMASGSASLLSQYATTVTCTNTRAATAGVTQPALPTNLAAQSVALIPQPDDGINCAFSNVAITMTNVAKTPAATDPMSAPETDSFTLTNTSSVPGKFTVQPPTIAPFTGTTAGTALTPSGYSLTVGTTTTTYTGATALAQLDAAIQANAATAAGASIVVGVSYTTSGGGATSDVVSLPATITSGTGTSAVANATETDTLTAQAALAIVKTGTTQTSPGGLIGYSILVTNNGPSPATGATFSDPMPSGVSVTGTPTCATTSGGAVCGSVSVAAGNGATPQSVTSTLGTFPSGSSVTFTITAVAAATCANASSPCTYSNTASIADPAGTTGTTQTSTLATVVQQSNGLSKTVANITQGGSAVTSNSARPGDVLQYVLTFTNTTGQPIYGLTVSDVIPSTTTYTTVNAPVSCAVTQSSGTPPACTASFSGSTASGNLPAKAAGTPLAAGGSVTVTFQVKVN